MDVIIKKIDTTTTEEEILSCVRRDTGYAGAIPIYTPQMESKIGWKQAFISLPAKIGYEIIRKKWITIGWSTCRVEEKIIPPQCFRCHGVGHTSKNCKGEDKRTSCFKCGIEGHTKKECVNEAKCSTCGKHGHKSGTTRCERYREILKEMMINKAAKTNIIKSRMKQTQSKNGADT